MDQVTHSLLRRFWAALYIQCPPMARFLNMGLGMMSSFVQAPAIEACQAYIDAIWTVLDDDRTAHISNTLASYHWVAPDCRSTVCTLLCGQTVRAWVEKDGRDYLYANNSSSSLQAMLKENDVAHHLVLHRLGTSRRAWAVCRRAGTLRRRGLRQSVTK